MINKYKVASGGAFGDIMSFKDSIQPYATDLRSSKIKRTLLRRLSEWARRLRRTPHEALYFHRADDPYCQLMVQILPEIIDRFNIKIRPLVVERLPAEMYPDPARYEAYSIVDAARVAKLYGLGFPSDATVPDALSTGMVNRHLVSIQDDPDFFAKAEEMGAFLWRRAVGRIQERCSVALVVDDKLRDNERTLRSAGGGHYASGSLYYRGEWYVGIDRLDHFEQRMNELHLGDGEVHYDLQRLWRYGLRKARVTESSGPIDFYFSLRSPYSYLALEQLAALSSETGVKLQLKPILPPPSGGLASLANKRRYLLLDSKREAMEYRIPFGRFSECDSKELDYGLAIGCYLASLDQAKALIFYRVYLKAVMAEGIDASSDKGLEKIAEKAGISHAILREALSESQWRQKAEQNYQDMLMNGCWGVPSIRTGDTTVWGQDRIWVIAEALGDKSKGDKSQSEAEAE